MKQKQAWLLGLLGSWSGEVPGHLQNSDMVPMSKVPNPQALNRDKVVKKNEMQPNHTNCMRVTLMWLNVLTGRTLERRWLCITYGWAGTPGCWFQLPFWVWSSSCMDLPSSTLIRSCKMSTVNNSLRLLKVIHNVLAEAPLVPRP